MVPVRTKTAWCHREPFFNSTKNLLVSSSSMFCNFKEAKNQYTVLKNQQHKLNIKNSQRSLEFLAYKKKVCNQPNKHGYLSCMPMSRLWRKFPPKAIQSWEVRTAWIHPARGVKKMSTADRHMLTHTCVNKHLVYTDRESFIFWFKAKADQLKF